MPKYILLPMVMVLCIVGSFGTNNRIFDVWTLLLWGVMGFILTKFDLPLTPIIMGFILGPICEKYLRRGLMRQFHAVHHAAGIGHFPGTFPADGHHYVCFANGQACADNPRKEG